MRYLAASAAAVRVSECAAIPQVRQLRRDRTDIDDGAAVVAHRQDFERFASLFLTPSGYNDRRSLFTKRDGRGATDARRDASHKGNLPLKMSHIIDPFSASRRSTVSITLRT
jgi:hypothetical protein